MLVVLAFLLAFALCSSGGAQQFERAVGVSKAGLSPVDVTKGSRTIPGGGATDSFTAHGITFNIWYVDVINNTNNGFDHATSGADRRARMADTLTYVADVLNDTGTLDIVVNQSQTDGTGFLASAGTYNPCANGFWGGSTLWRLNNGSKQFGASLEEIFVTVDFGYTWNAGTGAPTGGQFDLQSVLLHEITHGLGFFSQTTSTGASQFNAGVCGGTAYASFTTYDTLVVTSEDANVWSGNPPSLQVSSAELTSNDLFTEGTNSISDYDQGGTNPGLYAPASFAQGSSISHWDTGNIIGGAVMEHSIAPGEQVREFSPVDVGMLVDIGHTGAALPGDPLDPDNPYVTFGGPNGNGASTSPFNNLADALSAANPGATIHIAPGTSSETFTGGSAINQDVTLTNTTGASDVEIGSGGARSIGDNPRKSGFISRP